MSLQFQTMQISSRYESSNVPVGTQSRKLSSKQKSNSFSLWHLSSRNSKSYDFHMSSLAIHDIQSMEESHSITSQCLAFMITHFASRSMSWLDIFGADWSGLAWDWIKRFYYSSDKFETKLKSDFRFFRALTHRFITSIRRKTMKIHRMREKLFTRTRHFLHLMI